MLERLGRLFWYTVEFGLIRQGGEIKVYGSGVISSHGECANVLQGGCEVRDFNLDEVLTRAAHRRSADDIATPAVQVKAAKLISDAGTVGDDGESYLAMAGSFTRRRKDGQTLVCLPADVAGNLTFTLAGAFVSDLSVTPDESGEGCPQDKP